MTVKITFSDDSYLNTTFTDEVTVEAGKATAKEIIDHTGRLGKLNNTEYVLIMARYGGGGEDSYLKWATQNLAVTDSGKAKWKGTNYVIGDYFQWAAYDGYVSGTKPTNLVIYNSFTNICAGGAGNAFTFKDSKMFEYASAPYYSADAYNKYNDSDISTRPKLEQSDDVANIVLGSTWRMPIGKIEGTIREITAMREVTYWAWDDTDKGYYVFKPGVGTLGAEGDCGIYGTTDDKTKALLFFPAAGYGDGTDLYDAGSCGYYWSSTPNSDNIDHAFSLFFDSSCVNTESEEERYLGFPVRPVSD